MKTVFYYGIDNNYGGMEKFAFSVISEILNRGKEFQFHIISEYPDFAYKEILTSKYGCKYTILPPKKSHPVLYCKKLISILRAENNGLFHINLMSYRNFLLLYCARKTKIKSIIFGHSCNSRFKLLHIIMRRIFSKLGFKIALNNETNKFMFNNKADIIIPNAIDDNLYKFNQFSRDIYRNKLGIDKDMFLIGQFGRICKQKNQKFSVALINSLNSKDYKLILAGKELDNKQLKKMNPTNCILLGEVNVLEYYSAIDLLIVPSLFEGLSLTLLEGLACNIPVICSQKVPKLEECGNVLFLPLKKRVWLKAIEDRKFSRQVLPKKYTLGSWVEEMLKVYKSQF